MTISYRIIISFVAPAVCLLALSGCIGVLSSSSKQERIDVLEYKIAEIGQQLRNVEEYSKEMNSRLSGVTRDSERMKNENRVIRNSITSMEDSSAKSAENFHKMKKAIISTQKALKKIHARVIGIDTQQSDMKEEIGTISNAVVGLTGSRPIRGGTENPLADNGDEFDNVNNRKVVLNYKDRKSDRNEDVHGDRDSAVSRMLNAARSLSADGKLNESIGMYNKILADDPGRLEAYYELGGIYYDHGMVNESIDIYEKLAALNPQDAEVHSLLGVSYARADMISESIAELKEALKINPNLAEVHVGLSVAYLKKKMTDEAIAANKTAIAIDPNLAKAHKYLGIAYKRKGMKRKAKESFKLYKKLTSED